MLTILLAFFILICIILFYLANKYKLFGVIFIIIFIITIIIGIIWSSCLFNMFKLSKLNLNSKFYIEENINELKDEKEDLRYYEKMIYPIYGFKSLFKNY